VTPSFNQGRFLEATIRSVLLQGYPNLEFIVLDGGSTDGSVAIIEHYSAWLTRWSSARDKGQSDAIQRGLTSMDFRMGGWLNSDDVLRPGALVAVARHLWTHPACEFLTGDGLFTDEDGVTAQHYQRGAPHAFDDLLRYGAGDFLPQPSVFFSKSLFERAGGVDEHLHFAMDLDLWLRMRREQPLCYLPQCLSDLRQHGDAKTVGQNDSAMREVELVVERYAADRPPRVANVARRAMRRLRAERACDAGLQDWLRGDRRGSRARLVSAAWLHPPIVWTRAFGRVFARLTLPGSLRRRLLSR